MNNFLKRPIAHRGLFDNINIVENTLASFNNAIDNDYAIELDVVLSKDHEAIVFHDYDLKRLANKDIQIKDLTSQELRNILLLDTDSSIPTLDEVLYAVNGKTPLMIEIKSGNHPFIEERLTEILKSYDGPVCVKSFDINTVKWFKINAPFIKYGLIGSNLDININELKDLNIDFLSYDIKFINDAIVTEAKNKKIPIVTWTINSIEKFEEAHVKADNIIFEKIDLSNLLK